MIVRHWIVAALLSACLVICTTSAQSWNGSDEDRRTDSTARDARNRGAARWYDTLEVTRPRHVLMTSYDRLMLSVFSAGMAPTGLALALLTLAAPSVAILVEEGVAHGGVGLSTGIGFGGSQDAEVYWPHIRLQLEANHYFYRSTSNNWRISLMRDVPITSVHRRGYVWFGLSGGFGLSIDETSRSAFAEGSIGVMNPLGIRFLTLYPMHTWGLRGRAGWDPTASRIWHEIALAGSATFAW